MPYWPAIAGYGFAALFGGIRVLQTNPTHLLAFVVIQLILFGLLMLLMLGLNKWSQKRKQNKLDDIRKKNEEAIGWKGWGK